MAPLVVSVSRHRTASAVVLGVVLLLALVATLTLVDTLTMPRWVAQCQALGGLVSTVAPDRYNPLITESGDPHYVCARADGTVLAVRH